MSRGIRVGHSKKGMVALFMAITIQLILVFALIGFTENNLRYIDTARNYEDKVKAKYLALSSVNFSVLILQIQKKMVDPINKNFKLNFQLWKQLPISSELLSLVFGGDTEFFRNLVGAEEEEMDDIDSKQDAFENKQAQKDRLDKSVKNRDKDSSKESEGEIKFENEFKFDGDFFAEIVDEDGKFSINTLRQTGASKKYLVNAIKENLKVLFDQPEHKLFFESERENDEVISADEVISSMLDWVDQDDNRDGFNGGSESDRYSYLKRKYKSKNERLTSFQELYMIYGVDDDFMETFGEGLTVYTDNQININTCNENVLRAIVRGVTNHPPSYEEEHSQEMALLIGKIVEYRTLTPFTKAEELYSILNAMEGVKVDYAQKVKRFKLKTTSDVFKITGYGTLHEAVSKITIVIDNKNPEKQYLYYREE